MALLGCLTVLGIAPWDIVVRLTRIEGGADHGLELSDDVARGGRERVADLLAGVREAGQRGRRVADHRGEVERARGLIEGPQRLGTVGVLGGEDGEGRLGRGVRPEPVIEGAQERERVEARRFEARTLCSVFCVGSGRCHVASSSILLRSYGLSSVSRHPHQD